MPIQLEALVQTPYEASDELARVSDIAARLQTHLDTLEIQALLVAANRPKASSAIVQESFLAYARTLGFRDERRGLFASYETAALRPDYYMPVGETGILMEVERGRTTTNNMDLVDFWKCHICEHAHYLFLLVPIALRQNDVKRPTNGFDRVVRRLRTFFVPENYTNVRGAFVFGY